MRTAFGLLLLTGCSLALNNDDLRFGDVGPDGSADASVDVSGDAPVDASTDVGDASTVDCTLDEQCPTTPGRLAECRDGACIDLGCAAGRDDCDGVPGNGCEVDIQTSLQHCGSCGLTCTFPGAAGVCSAGVCTIGECRAGFGNCDTSTATGCETAISLPAACGDCDTMCSDGSPICDSTRDPFACVADCGVNTLCDLTCADLESSLEHCGACDRACPDVAGASAQCAAGECGFACTLGLADCNTNASDGCEVTLESDLLNCGACDEACDAPNTVPVCTDGACGIAMCVGSSFRSCDADETNGCETDVATSTDHCGGCNNFCDGPCVEGVCDPIVSGDGGPGATCVVRTGGTVECWGDNTAAQILGLRFFEDGGPASIQRVDDMPLLATSVSLGNAAICALDPSGKAWCWGNGDFGQLGNGSFVDSPRAVRVTGSPEFNALTLSSVHTYSRIVCALATNNEVWCWGRNSDSGGRMIPGAPATHLENPVQADVPAMRAIGVGPHHVCGITMSEDVMCWGDGTNGELGDDNATNSGTPVDASAPGFDEVVELAMQANSTCARTRAGELWCWGGNGSGELALGDREQRNIPTLVALDGVLELAATSSSACARTDAGLYCWGRFNEGATGLPDAVGAVDLPTRVDAPGAPSANQALGDANALIGGDKHMCAIVDGRPHCWGANERGQLGTTETMTYFSPTESSLENVADVAVGAFDGCALTDDNAVYCWGLESNGLGRILGGVIATATPGLLRMPLSNVTSIAFGTGHACAAHDGIVSCWGGGAAANLVLGVPSPVRSTDPIQVPLPALDVDDEWEEVSTGVFHSCARSTAGRVACWGDNTYNELGRTDTSAGAPGFMTTVTDAVALELGQYRSHAIRSNGEVVRWGLGITSSGPAARTVMTNTGALSDVVALSAGRFHACAISDPDPGGAGGTVYCWGNDASGQLGLAVPGGRDEAVAVPGIDDAISVSAGHYHSCAARASGEVLCWGNGVAGQTADASRPDIALPTVIAGLEATALFGGHSSVQRTFALRSDGTLVCWGNNVYGTCGAGEQLYFPEAAEALGL